MLSELPLEILRRICTNLSPEAALCFAHSCQHTYRACDDWAVWRNIVKGSARVRTEPPTKRFEESRQQNEIMTGANVVRPGDGFRNMSAVKQYMSQLMVLGCKRFDYCKTQLHANIQ